MGGNHSRTGLYHPEADVDAPRTILDPAANLREVSPSGEARITFGGIDKWSQTPSDRLLFSFRLDGGSWSPFENSDLATYHRLPAGTHRFEVRSMDRNGNIDPTGQSLDFAVPLPWYRQIGFLALMAVGSVRDPRSGLDCRFPIYAPRQPDRPTASCQAAGGSRQPAQERIPGQHEP